MSHSTNPLNFSRRARTLLALAPVVALAGLTLVGCGGDMPIDPEGVTRYGAYAHEKDAPQKGGEGAGAAALAPVNLAAARAPAAPAAPAAAAAPAAPAPVQGKPKKAAKYEAGPVEQGGTVEVTVTLTRAPEGAKIQFNKNKGPGQCGHDDMPNERAVFDATSLGLANAVVFLVDVAKGKPFEGELAEEGRTVTLDQVSCRYEPHVALVRMGARVAVKNSDPVQHNVKAYLNSKATPRFNIMSSSNSLLPPNDETLLDRAGNYLLFCDIHGWMTGFIHAVPHPYYAVTGPKGTASLTNVPPGQYKVGCWHEGMVIKAESNGAEITGYGFSDNFNLPEQVVTVPPAGTVQVSFTTDPR